MSDNGQTPSYAKAPQGGTPTYTEAWALIEAARRMADAITAEEPVKAMREALRLNWRLWTIFQAELTGGGVGVPDDIRINMLTLCKFVDSHTVNAIHEPAPRKLEVLVNINRNIAAGLLDSLNKAIDEQQKEQPAAPEVPSVAEELRSFDGSF